MRTIEFPELEAIRTELDPDIATRQLIEVSAALAAAGPVTRRHRLAGWRRWLATVAVSVSALVPAAAVASESAVPGDALYSIKRALEPLVELVNSDVVAEHRIEELEVLEVTGADQELFDSLVQEATDAVARTDAPPLSDRLDAVVARRTDRATDQIEDREEDQGQDREEDQPTDRPSEDESDRSATTTANEPVETAPAGDSATTTTSTLDAPRDEQPDETTNTAPPADDGAPVGGDRPTDATSTTAAETDR